MRITLLPFRGTAPLALAATGDVLSINGDTLDLSTLPDGATLPTEAIGTPWAGGPAHRVDGELHVHIRLPHGIDPPEETLWPEDIVVTADGPVSLPPFERPAGDAA